MRQPIGDQNHENTLHPRSLKPRTSIGLADDPETSTQAQEQCTTSRILDERADLNLKWWTTEMYQNTTQIT